MGIYIKGMEMPAKCKDCDLVDTYQMQCPLMPGVVSLYKEFSDAIQENRRSKYCPLVPVPEHGRLIDADKLHYSKIDLLGNHLVYMVDIEAAPTIIPADKEGEG